MPKGPKRPTPGQVNIFDDNDDPSQKPITEYLQTKKLDDDAKAKAMSQRYDRLNSLWKTAEEKVKRFLIPKLVLHEYRNYLHPDEDAAEHDMYIHEAVAWAKVKGAWRLCHGYYDESWDHGSGDRGYTFTPILDSSIEIRTACIPEFTPLYLKVIEAVEVELPSLDEAIVNLEKQIKLL